MREGFRMTEIGELPTDWGLQPLGDLGITYGGLSGKSKEDFGEGQPFITYKSIFDSAQIDSSRFEFVRVAPSEKQNKVQYGDVCFTTSSETPEEVGMSSILMDEVGDVYLNSFCFGFRQNKPEELIPEYAKYYFRGPWFRRDITFYAPLIPSKTYL